MGMPADVAFLDTIYIYVPLEQPASLDVPSSPMWPWACCFAPIMEVCCATLPSKHED